MNVTNLDISQLDSLSQLLEKENLPVSDLHSANWFALRGIENQGDVIAAGGLEQCGQALLLRSVIVAPPFRGKGLAQLIVGDLHSKARSADYRNIYLMTLDAESWFEKNFVYKVMDRAGVPADIAASSQFTHTCPGTASLMVVSI
jgi:amino-acid N-acetyltransferase